MNQNPSTPTPTIKCLVWDLDDTLWHGTLAEGDDVRVPDPVRAAVLELDRRGILQSVASRNDHDRAWAQLTRLGLAEYFLLPQIGWGPKSAGIRAVAEALGFAEDTIAFIDDRAVERAEVGHHLPGVRCYPAEVAAGLPDRPEFQPRAAPDAALRRARYQAEGLRTAARADFGGTDAAFLGSLGITMTVAHATEADLDRVEELTLRTSQMNATGVHYDQDALRALISEPAHDVLIAAMSDRFGEHGAIGIVLLQRGAAAWRIRLLATSCRVVAYGAGAELLRWLAAQAARAEVHLLADFRRTDRNRMAAVAYRFAGFRQQECACHHDAPPDSSDVPETPDGEAQLLHLVPNPGPAEPGPIRLTAPDLGLDVLEARG